LRFSLKGLRSLRVGDYRVVFRIQKNEVFIVLIAHRSFVYKEADKRRQRKRAALPPPRAVTITEGDPPGS
jgi:hypothetical protein